MKLLYVGDPHNRPSNPKNRMDDFEATYRNKVEEIKQVAKKQGVKGILQPGDFLDAPKYETSFLMDVINLWSFVPDAYDLMAQLQKGEGNTADIVSRLQENIPYIGAIGNHELKGNSLARFPNSSLDFLNKMHFMELASKENPIIFTDDDGTTVAITATHYHAKMDAPGNEEDYIVRKKAADFHIHMVHGYLTNKNLGPLIPHTTLDKVANETVADLTIAGHDHIGFPLTEVGGKLFINPGSMTRTKNDIKEIRRRPKYLLIDIDKNTGVTVTVKPLKSAAIGTSVLSRKDIEAKQAQGSRMEEIKSIVNRAQMKQGQTITDIISAISTADKIDEEITKEVVERVSKKMEYIDGNDKKSVQPFTITQIVLDNFQSHSHSVLDVHDGLNVIVGRSSNGKSSIFRAMRWLFDNNGNKKKGYIKEGETEARVTVVLSNGVRISRISSKKASGKNGYEVYNPLTGDVEFGNTRIVDEIRELLGYKKIVFDASESSREELDVNFMNQGDGWFFIGKQLKGSERSKIIGSIFGTHYTDAVMRELEDELKKNNSQIRMREKDIEESQEQLNGYIYLNDVEKRLEKAQLLQDSIQAKQAKLESLKELIIRKDKLMAAQKEAQDMVSSLNGLDLWKLQLQNLKEKQERALKVTRILERQESITLRGRADRAAVKQLSQLPILQEKLDALRAKEADRVKLETTIVQYTALKVKQKAVYTQMKQSEVVLEKLKDLDAAREVLTELRSKQQVQRSLETLISNQVSVHGLIRKEKIITETSLEMQSTLLEEYRDVLVHAGTCPTCHSSIDDIVIDRIIRNYTGKELVHQ